MQKLHYILFVTCTLMLTAINLTNAQVNIEKLRTENSSNISLGVNINIGNNNVTTVDAATLVLKKLSVNNFIILKAKYNKGFKDNKDFVDNYFGHIRLTSMMSKRLGIEVFSQAEGDDFRALLLRQLNGTGLRLNISKEKLFNVNLGLGIMSDYEKISIDNKTTSLFFARYTSYISIIKSFKDSKNEIILMSYVQPRLTEFSDIRVTIEFLIRLIVSDRFKVYLDNSVDFKHDSKPPVGIETNDFTTKSMVTYEW